MVLRQKRWGLGFGNTSCKVPCSPTRADGMPPLASMAMLAKMEGEAKGCISAQTGGTQAPSEKVEKKAGQE